MDGTLSLFGYPSTEAHLDVRPRSAGWRASRASLFAGGGLVLAPFLGLLPPHAPWAVAALGIGGVLGLRKWRERFTLLGFQGRCPRCGSELELEAGIPVKSVMTVPCKECNHDSKLTPRLPRRGQDNEGTGGGAGT